jgi:hypothetical protein
VPAAQLVQAPPLIDTWLSEQSTQAVKGLTEVLPAAQLVQASPLAADIVPAVHSIQAAPLAELWPASQLVQVVKGLAEVVPAAQLVHTVLPVVSAAYFPAPQSWQLETAEPPIAVLN